MLLLPDFQSRAAGVGRPGEDENAPAEMTGTDCGGGNTEPFRIEPDFGQVCENGSKCPHSRFRTGVSQAPRALFHVAVGSLTEQLLNVLDHNQRRPQRGDGARHVVPEATPGALPHPGALAGAGDVLAREPGRQHVHRRYGGPVGLGDVPEVCHGGEPLAEDLRGARIAVRHPGKLSAEDRLQGQVEAPVTGTEGTRAKCHAFPLAAL